MKLVIRIFNIVFMAIAAAAIVCLLVLPTFKVTLGYKMTPDQMAEAFPSSQSEGDDGEVDIKKLLGDEGITLNLSVEVSPKLLFNSLTGDPQTVIDKQFIEPNVKSIVSSIKEPINKIGTGMIKILFSEYYIELFEKEIDAVKGSSETRTNEQIRNAGGLTDAYFETMAEDTYKGFNVANATVDSANNIMLNSVKAATNKFNSSNAGLTLPPVDENNKDAITDATHEMLDGMGMIKPDGKSIYPLSMVMDAMMVDAFRSSNNEKVPEGETLEEKAGKLNSVLADFIKGVIPSDSYSTIAMVLKIILAVLAAFVATWSVHFIFTFIRTIFARNKIWTFTGPIFWILGVIQIILGIGLTVAVGYVMNSGLLSKVAGDSSEAASVISNINVSIYTSMFIPSILLIVLIPTSIVYAVFKGKYKRQLKAE